MTAHAHDLNGSQTRPVRLDELVHENEIVMVAVDQFDGYAVDVALPAEWEPVKSDAGQRVCIWRADPLRRQFCTNVVLTMTQIEASFDPAEVFPMLCEWQMYQLPGTQEISRECAPATEGPGVVGSLGLQIPSANGLLDSVTVMRILATAERTLIAQLSLTALPESPVDRDHIGLAVTSVVPAGAAVARRTSIVTESETAGKY